MVDVSAPDEEISVSKLDAARRQLVTAVKLYFASEDPVSIHALVAASHQVLGDLNKHRGGNPMAISVESLSVILPEFRPEFRKVLRKIIVGSATFLKHAEHDPDDVLRFQPRETEILLIECCLKYQELSGEAVPELVAFTAWFLIFNPIDDNSEMFSEQAQHWRAVFVNRRSEFFREVIPFYTQQFRRGSNDALAPDPASTDTDTDTR